jgi:transcriptional regulator with XRE-family HTH domain
MSQTINALKHIRTKVFEVKQQEFAAIAGVPQSQVSRWENDKAAPTLEEMNRIRAEAERRRGERRLKRKWDDRLFFAEPQQAGAQ